MSVGGNFVHWPVKNRNTVTWLPEPGFHEEKSPYAESDSRHAMFNYVNAVENSVTTLGPEHPSTCAIGDEGHAFRKLYEESVERAQYINIALGTIAATGTFALVATTILR